MTASIASSTCTRSRKASSLGGPAELARNTREVTAAFIAAGIDPKRHIVFNQSQVSAHAELAWIFNCVARIGWLNRMTQFKDKAGKDRENASVGLFDYPVLMAADILALPRHPRAGRRGPEAAPRARRATSPRNSTMISATRSAATASTTGFLSAARALDHRSGDAGDEPARRHQEDVEVRFFG